LECSPRYTKTEKDFAARKPRTPLAGRRHEACDPPVTDESCVILAYFAIRCRCPIGDHLRPKTRRTRGRLYEASGRRAGCAMIRRDGPPRMVARSTWSGRERSSHSRFPPVPRVGLVTFRFSSAVSSPSSKSFRHEPLLLRALLRASVVPEAAVPTPGTARPGGVYPKSLLIQFRA